MKKYSSKSVEISIIVPTFKPGKYLYDCLNSLIYQTLSSDTFEIIIVLNGDKYPFIEGLKDFITRSGRNNIRLLYSEKKGVSAARNLGLDHALGDAVSFIDDDDIVSANYLEEIRNVWDKRSVVITNLKTFHDDIGLTGSDYITNAFERCKSLTNCSLLQAKKFFSSACGKLIPLKVIGNTRFDLKMKRGEDSVFMVEISGNLLGILFTSGQAVYYRRIRNGSASRSSIPINEFFAITIYEIWKYISFGFLSPGKYNIIFILFRILASLKSFAKYLFSKIVLDVQF